MVYKVVRKTETGFRSAMFPELHPCLTATYEIGKTTYPPIEGSCLFAFELFTMAKGFASGSGEYAILCAEAEVSLKTTHPYYTRLPKLGAGIDCIKRFWKEQEYGYSGMRMPMSTVLCDSITPIRVLPHPW